MSLTWEISDDTFDIVRPGWLPGLQGSYGGCGEGRRQLLPIRQDGEDLTLICAVVGPYHDSEER